MNTQTPKLPAHLQPWPEHWLPKADYLAALAEPRHYYKIVAALAADADRNQVSAALARLVKSGEATRDERNYYQATGQRPQLAASAPQAWTAEQIAAACESIGRDPAPILAALRGDIPPESQVEPASPPAVIPPAPPFAGPPEAAIATCRAILRDNEAQALTLGEWDELARADGIDLAPLMRDHSPALLADVAAGEREDCVTYWLPAAPSADTDDDPGVCLDMPG